MKQVPTTWDDVRFIDGYPGKYVILARRHGDKWYVAGVNAQQETLKTEISLPMWASGTELQVYADDNKLQGEVREETDRESNDSVQRRPDDGKSVGE